MWIACLQTAADWNGGTSQTQGCIDPRGGILFRPDAATQLFFAYGQSLIPNTSVQIQSGEAPPPRRDTQYEIGFRRELSERKTTFEVGLFDITRDNVAIANPANPSGFYSVVTGQQHSHGVEVNLVGEVLPNLKVNVVATFLHAVVSKDDNVPSQLGGDLKGLECGASCNYASRARATLPNTYGFTLPPQQLFGATLAYHLNNNIKIELSATNLMDRQNWTSNGALFHGEPRSVSVCLSYRY